MSWTKREVIEQAYTEIGLAGYTFDVQPEELQNAMYVLDSLMAEWGQINTVIAYTYPFPDTKTSGDLDDPTNIADEGNRAMYLNLATLIAAGEGKQVLPKTTTEAEKSYIRFVGRSVRSVTMKSSGTIKGAGYKNTYYPFT